MTVALNPSTAPVAFDELVDAGINRPARYMGHELGVEPYLYNTYPLYLKWSLIQS